MQRRKDAAVLFSGGIDSTYLVERIAGEYNRIQLITFIVPGIMNVKHSRSTFLQIRRRHKNVEHKVIDIRDFVLRTRGGIKDCIRDNIRFNFFYSWCLGCKLSMHLYMIKYCKEQGTNIVLDGSNVYDTHALEQYSYVKDIFKKIYDEHKISYQTPFYKEGQIRTKKGFIIGLMKHLTLYKDATAYKAEYLEDRNYILGGNLFSQYRDIQPSCYISPVFNLVRLPYKIVFSEKKKSVRDYIEHKRRCLTR